MKNTIKAALTERHYELEHDDIVGLYFSSTFVSPPLWSGEADGVVGHHFCRCVRRAGGRTGEFCCPRFHALHSERDDVLSKAHRTRRQDQVPRGRSVPVAYRMFNASSVTCSTLAFECSCRRWRRFVAKAPASGNFHPPSHPYHGISGYWRLPRSTLVYECASSQGSRRISRCPSVFFFANVGQFEKLNMISGRVAPPVSVAVIG